MSVYSNLYHQRAIDKRQTGEVRTHLEKVVRCLKRLVVFGASTNDLQKDIFNANVSTDLKFELLNVVSHSLNLKEAIFSFLVSRKSEEEFRKYISYALTIPVLKKNIKANDTAAVIVNMSRAITFLRSSASPKKFYLPQSHYLKLGLQHLKTLIWIEPGMAHSLCATVICIRAPREKILKMLLLQK